MVTTTEKPKKSSNKVEQRIQLPEMRKEVLELRIEGTSPLIVNAWSEKAIRQILDKQMKKAQQAKQAKDPFQDFCNSLHWISEKPENPTPEDIANGVFGFPSIGFKAAAVSACSQVSGITKVFARGAFHCNLGEELTEIIGPPPEMREDMVRIAMGTADIRYRGMFREWGALLKVIYNASAISPEQIINLVETAGFSTGIGEWRAERDGNFGMFRVSR